jgi:cytochrome c553
MNGRLHWGVALASSLFIGTMTIAKATSAADAKAGRTKSQPCSVCHGATGISTLPDAPNLAGQPEIYLSNQLRSYRSGERRHEVMSLVAKTLSDDDIADLAAWFSSIRIEAKPPG